MDSTTFVKVRDLLGSPSQVKLAGCALGSVTNRGKAAKLIFGAENEDAVLTLEQLTEILGDKDVSMDDEIDFIEDVDQSREGLKIIVKQYRAKTSPSMKAKALKEVTLDEVTDEENFHEEESLFDDEKEGTPKPSKPGTLSSMQVNDQPTRARSRSRSPGGPKKPDGPGKPGGSGGGSGGGGSGPGGSGGGGGSGGSGGRPGQDDANLEAIMNLIKAFSGMNGVDVGFSESEMVKGFCNDVIYQGFNPKEMKKQILREALRRKVDAKQLLLQCLCILHTRGANVERMTRVMKPEGMRIVNQVINVLRVKPKALGDKDAITLPRIASCFPELAIAVSHYCTREVVHKMIDEDFPLALRSPSIGALIPRSPVEKLTGSLIETLSKAIIAYQSYCSMAYSKKPGMEMTAEVKGTQERFFNIARDQGEHDDKLRYDILSRNRFGIIFRDPTDSNSYVLHPAILRMASKYSRA